MTQYSSYRSYPVDGEAARQEACVWVQLLQEESISSLSKPRFFFCLNGQISTHVMHAVLKFSLYLILYLKLSFDGST